MSSRLAPAAAFGALGLCILLLFILSSSVSLAQSAPTIEEYGFSRNVTAIDAMAIDPAGNVWLVDSARSTLYRFNVSSMTFDERPVPFLVSSHYTGMSVDATGIVWLADKPGNRVLGYDSVKNQFYKFDFPSELQLEPAAVIRYGDDLWVGMNMELGKVNIERGDLTDYYVYSHKAELSDIKMDGARNVWFVEYNAGKVGGYIYARDDTMEVAIPTNESYPTSLAVDSQKRLWFIESGPNKLGMYDTTNGAFREFNAPALDGQPSSLNRVAVDADDNVWLTDTARGRIIKYYPTKNVSVPIYLNNDKSYPTLIGIDDSGNVWVVESGAKKLAKLHADPLYGLTGTPTPTSTATPVPTSTATATATEKPTPGFEPVTTIIALIAVLCLASKLKL